MERKKTVMIAAVAAILLATLGGCGYIRHLFFAAPKPPITITGGSVGVKYSKGVFDKENQGQEGRTGKKPRRTSRSYRVKEINFFKDKSATKKCFDIKSSNPNNSLALRFDLRNGSSVLVEQLTGSSRCPDNPVGKCVIFDFSALALGQETPDPNDSDILSSEDNAAEMVNVLKDDKPIYDELVRECGAIKNLRIEFDIHLPN